MGRFGRKAEPNLDGVFTGHDAPGAGKVLAGIKVLGNGVFDIQHANPLYAVEFVGLEVVAVVDAPTIEQVASDHIHRHVGPRDLDKVDLEFNLDHTRAIGEFVVKTNHPALQPGFGDGLEVQPIEAGGPLL